MKKTVPFLIAICALQPAIAQEFALAEIDKTKPFDIVVNGMPDMSITIPHFVTGDGANKKFSVVTLGSHDLREAGRTELEIPSSYEYKASTSAMGTHMLIFYDKNKKEDVFIAMTEQNVTEKKTFKSKGLSYQFVNAGNPEIFSLIAFNPSGSYTVQAINQKLEQQWERTFAPKGKTQWDILSIDNTMEGAVATIKETEADGKVAFIKQRIPFNKEEEIQATTIKVEDKNVYPTFTTNKDGMSFAGGYFYNNGVYNYQPDGVFFAMLSPEGNADMFAKVPFSQIIEDLKTTVGSKLNEPNTTIIFSDGMIDHGSQNVIMSGQVITKGKDGVITTGEVVTIIMNTEKGYIRSSTVDVGNHSITLSGDHTKTNIVDLGMWMRRAGLMPFTNYAQGHMPPILTYKSYNQDGRIEYCYKNAALKLDTGQHQCEPLIEEAKSADKYTFSGIAIPQYPKTNYGTILIPDQMDGITKYEMKDFLLLQKLPAPNLENIRVEMLPEDQAEEEEPQEEEQPEEEEPQE